MRRYPLGIQTFSEIIDKGWVYIDKTATVFNLAHVAKYVFLSRPRRFGKSLLTSTLQCYFEGRQELFRGLAMEQLEHDWTRYPVLHFDMSLAKHVDEKRLNDTLEFLLQQNEAKYGVELEGDDVNLRLTHLIRRANEQTGRQVVGLIDEYDAPLLDVAYDAQTFEHLRQIMRNFYSPLKACDPYLRFVFLTGITKFSQLSIFSELNNLNNVSMDDEFASICGITQEELDTQMAVDVEALARKYGMSTGQTRELLKNNYDGYHFSASSPDIYNPFSLLTCFSKMRLDAYWFASGTPTYVVEMLNKFQMLPEQIDNQEATADYFDAPMQSVTSIMPLLYQSGYVTIKGYDPITHLYTLSIPNNEVREGLMKSLLGNYVVQPQIASTTVAKMFACLHHDDLDGMFTLLQTFLGTVPYTDNTQYEGHYQSLFYVIFSLLGQYVDIEVRTPRGRVDMVLRTESHLYVIELKIDQSADAAITQIDLNQYPERFALSGLPIIKVGVNFSTETRNVTGWKIEK